MCVCAPAEPVVNDPVSSCVCIGIALALNVTEDAPPVSPGVYAPPAPTTNCPRKSGVPLLPLHNCHPAGILAAVLFHITIIPVGKTACTNAVVATAVVESLAVFVVATEVIKLADVNVLLTPVTPDTLPPLTKMLLELKLVA